MQVTALPYFDSDGACVRAQTRESRRSICLSVFALGLHFSYIFNKVLIRSRRCTQSVERCARTVCRTVCRREDQLRLISCVLYSIFSYRVCLAPQWIHEHVSVPDVFCSFCEYISCHCKGSARAPGLWSSCVCPLADYTKSDPLPYLLSSRFENGYCWIYWEMTSGYCLRIPVVYVSYVKVDLGSRGRSWMASPDEYRLCTFLKDDFKNIF